MTTHDRVMKPHEEEWRWDDDRKAIVTGVRDIDADADGWRVIVETDSGCYPPYGAERQLIAQAPAMARMLLALTWSRQAHDGCHAACPSCRATTTVLRFDGYTYQMAEQPNGEHTDDCALVAVLRAAGVMP